MCEHRFCSQTKTLGDRNCTACFSLANIFIKSTNKSFGAKLQSEVTAGFTQVRIGNLMNQSATSCAISIPPLLEDCYEQKTFKDDKSQFADDAGQWAVSKNIDLSAEYLQRDLDKLARWCAKWRIKLNPEKTKVIIFSKSRFAIRAEPSLSLYGDLLSYYLQIKFLGVTFDNRITFTKHFEKILERCNHKFHRLRILVSKKWGPSPETILQIYKQCVRPIFEYGIVSTITVSETVITKIQRVQNSFIRLALRLPKYVSARLLHEASGLPYVKERLISVGQNH